MRKAAIAAIQRKKRRRCRVCGVFYVIDREAVDR